MALSEFENARARKTMDGPVKHRNPAYQQEVLYLNSP